jgi:hypothetical protein
MERNGYRKENRVGKNGFRGNLIKSIFVFFPATHFSWEIMTILKIILKNI